MICICSVADPVQSSSSESASEGRIFAIASWLFVAYVVLVLLFLLVSVYLHGTDGQVNKEWFEMTKTGFATLGSAFTLIIGYYFGQKNVAQELRQKVKDTEEDAKERLQRLAEKLRTTGTENQSPDKPPAGGRTAGGE